MSKHLPSSSLALCQQNYYTSMLCSSRIYWQWTSSKAHKSITTYSRHASACSIYFSGSILPSRTSQIKSRRKSSTTMLSTTTSTWEPSWTRGPTAPSTQWLKICLSCTQRRSTPASTTGFSLRTSRHACCRGIIGMSGRDTSTSFWCVLSGMPQFAKGCKTPRDSS